MAGEPGLSLQDDLAMAIEIRAVDRIDERELRSRAKTAIRHRYNLTNHLSEAYRRIGELELKLALGQGRPIVKNPPGDSHKEMARMIMAEKAAKAALLPSID